MQDPVVAADGLTYEAEAIKGWLDSGHNTSPMCMSQISPIGSNMWARKAIVEAIKGWLDSGHIDM